MPHTHSTSPTPLLLYTSLHPYTPVSLHLYPNTPLLLYYLLLYTPTLYTPLNYLYIYTFTHIYTLYNPIHLYIHLSTPSTPLHPYIPILLLLYSNTPLLRALSTPLYIHTPSTPIYFYTSLPLYVIYTTSTCTLYTIYTPISFNPSPHHLAF